MIYNYKLYIFDLDGTIIDSEYSHYEAYNLQLINKISFGEYENIFHDECKKKNFLIENNICKIKKESDFINIYNNNAKLIDGFEIFFNELIERGKDIIIIKNSSIERFIYSCLNNAENCFVKNFNLKDKFIFGSASRKWAWNRYNLSKEKILDYIALNKKKFK